MRFRPRFSVRTLAILVTLVCAYLGAWEATKRYVEQQVGEDRLYSRDKTKLLLLSSDYDSPQRASEMLTKRDLVSVVSHTDLVVPLVISQRESLYPEKEHQRVYYLWLIGPKIKLFERSVRPSWIEYW